MNTPLRTSAAWSAILIAGILLTTKPHDAQAVQEIPLCEFWLGESMMELEMTWMAFEELSERHATLNENRHPWHASLLDTCHAALIGYEYGIYPDLEAEIGIMEVAYYAILDAKWNYDEVLAYEIYFNVFVPAKDRFYGYALEAIEILGDGSDALDLYEELIAE